MVDTEINRLKPESQNREQSSLLPGCTSAPARSLPPELNTLWGIRFCLWRVFDV